MRKTLGMFTAGLALLVAVTSSAVAVHKQPKHSHQVSAQTAVKSQIQSFVDSGGAVTPAGQMVLDGADLEKLPWAATSAGADAPILLATMPKAAQAEAAYNTQTATITTPWNVTAYVAWSDADYSENFLSWRIRNQAGTQTHVNSPIAGPCPQYECQWLGHYNPGSKTQVHPSVDVHITGLFVSSPYAWY